jgi:uncharacterized HAD superfamily protein
MNIAIDIDDTLAESFDYFQPFVAEYFGVDTEEVRRRNISYGNLPPEWKSRGLDFFRTYYDRVVPDTPFKPDAAWGVAELKKMGHRIVIITGRSTAFYTDPYKTTTEELEKGGIVYDKLICTLEKGRACREERIDVLIDDLPANCDAAVKEGASAILFTSKANREEETIYPRVSDWQGVIEQILAMEKR